MIRGRQIVLLVACLWSSSVVVSATGPNRVFSENYIEGLYGRIFEFTDKGNSNPCPHVVDHFKRGNANPSGKSWIVPHDQIVMNGAACKDRGVLVLDSFDSSSSLPDGIESSSIAKETFELMRDESTGFWMGKDARKCGDWKFPFPTYVFFVKELDRRIKTSFNLELRQNKKYMFAVAPSFTCIYVDVPRKNSNPDVVINGGSGDSSSTNDTQADKKPITNAPSGSEEEEKDPKQTPTATAGTTGNVPESDDEDLPESDNTNTDTEQAGTDTEQANAGVTIVDIDNGAPAPAAKPSPNNSGLTIVDISENGGRPSRPSGSENSTSSDSSGDTIDEISIPGSSSEVTEANTGESLCFPADATVELSNGDHIRMDQLSIGDEVRISLDSFSQVFAFTHRNPQPLISFVQLTTRSRELLLTDGHYLYVNGALVEAKNVKAGDELSLENGTNAVVEKVSRRVSRGLYNPQTLHGDIIVNGIRTSTYTSTVDPQISHALLAPVRAIWERSKLNLFDFLLPSSSVVGRRINYFKSFVQVFHLLRDFGNES